MSMTQGSGMHFSSGVRRHERAVCPECKRSPGLSQRRQGGFGWPRWRPTGRAAIPVYPQSQVFHNAMIPSDRPHLKHWPRHLPRELVVPETTLWFNLEVSAARYPNKPVTWFFGRAMTYADLKAQAESLAGWPQGRVRPLHRRPRDPGGDLRC